jgi:hypothetical protein
MSNSAFCYGIIYHVSCARRLYTILTTLTGEKPPCEQKNKSHPSKAMPSFLIRKNIEKEEKITEERGIEKSRLETEIRGQ